MREGRRNFTHSPPTPFTPNPSYLASYPYSAPTVMPTPEFARGLRQLADQHGAMLVLDEIRTNFRVGGSLRGHWAELGPEVAPDMHTISKALGNGHPVAALVGNYHSREGAARIMATGTFWLSSAPMAAALATLDVLEADGCAAMAQMQAMGTLLQEGIAEQAERHGVAVTVSGPPAMPFVTFDEDDDSPATRPRGSAWCAAVSAGGSWLHPFHNWYISLAHSEADIAETLEATDRAFQATAR